MPLVKIFEYKFISFTGDFLDCLDYNGHRGRATKTDVNIRTLLSRFKSYCEVNNSSREYCVLKVGENKSLVMLWNALNDHNPYLMLYDTVSNQRLYSVQIEEVPDLHSDIWMEKVFERFEAFMARSKILLSMNHKADLWQHKDLQAFANHIDNYPLMGKAYDGYDVTK